MSPTKALRFLGLGTGSGGESRSRPLSSTALDFSIAAIILIVLRSASPHTSITHVGGGHTAHGASSFRRLTGGRTRGESWRARGVTGLGGAARSRAKTVVGEDGELDGNSFRSERNEHAW